jgi:toxin YoeB
MITAWTEDAWQDYLEQHEDEKTLEAINALIKDIERDPCKGLGKPEPLKHALQGWWSRRITGDHRLVYRVTGKGETQRLDIVQCKYRWCLSLKF